VWLADPKQCGKFNLLPAIHVKHSADSHIFFSQLCAWVIFPFETGNFVSAFEATIIAVVLVGAKKKV